MNSSAEVYWVPCVPDYITGSFIPLQTIATYQATLSVHSRSVNRLPKSINRGGTKSRPWSEAEDTRINSLIEELGLKQWILVAATVNGEFFGGEAIRKGKHCRERWHNHLDPSLNSNFYIEGEWSYEEDILVLKEQRVLGNKWSKIARKLNGRTENSVKNRYHNLVRRAKQTYSMELYPDESISYILVQEFEGKLLQTRE